MHVTRCLLLIWYFGLSNPRLQVYVLIISSRWSKQKNGGKLKQLFDDQNDDIDFTDGENNDEHHQETLLAIVEKRSMNWQVDTWLIIQYDEQWYPGIIQEVRLQNAHSQSIKLLMRKQESVSVPLVYQNNSYYILFFLLDQFPVSYEIFHTKLPPLNFLFPYFPKKTIKILKC